MTAATSDSSGIPDKIKGNTLAQLGFYQTDGNQWIFVLGASSGFGRAISLRMAELGYHVFGLYFGTSVQTEAAEETKKAVLAQGVKCEMRNINAASDKSRAETVAELVELVGPGNLRSLVHSLAFGALVPFIQTIKTGHYSTITEMDASTGTGQVLSQKQMQMTMEVMAHSLLWWVRDVYQAGLFREGSQIWAMTSFGDIQILDSYGAVSAAKSTLVSHVRQLAAELAQDEIAINALRAGVTRSPSFDKIPRADVIAEQTQAFNPHGRLTTAEDVADYVGLYSLSTSSWMTGAIVELDGGEGLLI